MKGFISNIEDITEENNNFRKILYTTQGMQLVVMSLLPHEDIGLETHEDVDQFFRVEEGKGKFMIGEETYDIEDDSAFIVPRGTQHNVINTGDKTMKLYTIYAGPHHKDGIIHPTKADAMIEEHFDGVTTE